MTLSDVMMDTKCFDLSRMSLSPSVINFETLQDLCSFDSGGYKW